MSSCDLSALVQTQPYHPSSTIAGPSSPPQAQQPSGQVFSPDLLPPPVGIYKNTETAYQAVQDHAKWHGYACRLHRRTGKNKQTYQIKCSKAGRYDPNRVPQGKRQRNTTIKMTNCPFEVKISPGISPRGSISWIKVINPEHNHGPSSSPSEHRQHRKVTPEQETLIVKLVSEGKPRNEILQLFSKDHSTFLTGKDISNIVVKARKEALRALEIVPPPPSPTTNDYAIPDKIVTKFSSEARQAAEIAAKAALQYQATNEQIANVYLEVATITDRHRRQAPSKS